MMSPKYWNLPKPGLIISITGNAAEFKEDNELSAHDQPYVLFKVDLPNASEAQKVNKKLFLPVRKFRDFKAKGDANEASKCDAISKNDSLSDVLFRIADYTAQSSADDDAHICRRTVAFWGVSLANLAKGIEFWGKGIKFSGKAKKRIEDVPKELKITFESGNPASEAVAAAEAKAATEAKAESIKLPPAPSNAVPQGTIVDPVAAIPDMVDRVSFVLSSGELQDKKMVDKQNELFETFMQKLNDLRIFSCVTVTFSFSKQLSTAVADSQSVGVSSPKQSLSVENSSLELIASKTIQIRELIKDAEIFLDSVPKTDQEMLLDVRVFHSDKFTDFQRRIENLSLLGQEGIKDGKRVLITEEDASYVKNITK